MTKYLKPLAGVAVFGLLSVSAAIAQKNTTYPDKANKEKTRSANRMTTDSTFATKAAQGNMAEVKLGQLAQTNASNAEVKQFGQRMIDDHTKALDQLKTTASQNNITLPTSISAKDQAAYDRLSKLNGAAFDRAYMRDMVSDHRTDISEFKREADSGTNPALKAYASQTLPTLEQHLKLAESTEKAVAR